MKFDTPIHSDQRIRLALEFCLEQARLNPEKWPPVHSEQQRRLVLEKDLKQMEQTRLNHEKERHEQRTAEAIAMGLTSAEELEEYEMEEWRQSEIRGNKRLAERAALEGKTLAELQAELCAGNKDFDPGPPLPSFSQCQCDEHPNPFFCPETLVDYHSQDLPDHMELSAEQHRLRVEEFNIQPDDVSRRLAPEALERAWDMTSPPLPRMQLPPWARGNKSITDLLDPPIVTRLDSGNYGAPSLVSTSPGAESISSPLVVTPEDLGMDTRYESQKPPESHEDQVSPPPTNTKNLPTVLPGKVRRPCRKSSNKISRVLKRTPDHARRTRSHKLIKFYELNQDGLAISSRKFPRVR